MSRYLFLVFCSLIFSLSTTLMAQNLTTEKTVCINAGGYKSIDEAKAVLRAMAKRAAVQEMFGEKITALTKVENFSLSEDVINTATIGVVKLSGNPEFSNGSNLGEICVTVAAYITEEDLKLFTPVYLTHKSCDSSNSMSAKELKVFVREKAAKDAITRYDPSLKALNLSLSSLLKNQTIVEEGFVPDTDTYCAKITGELYPIELVGLRNAPDINNKMKQSSGIKAVKYDFLNAKPGELYPDLGNYNMIVSAPKGNALTSSSESPSTSSFILPFHSNDFEINILIDLAEFENRISLWSNDSQVTAIDFTQERTRSYIKFGALRKIITDSNWKGNTDANWLKLSANNGVIRFYINDVFFSLVQTKKTGFDKVTISGLKISRDFIYHFSAKPL